MKLLLACAMAAMVAATECVCPKMGRSLLLQRNLGPEFDTLDHISTGIPPCCEDLVKMKEDIEKNGLVDHKHTPGNPCQSMSSCSTCTILTFCRWGRHIRDKVSTCVDAASEGEDFDGTDYVQSCADIGHSQYGLADISDAPLYEGKSSPVYPHVGKADRAGLKEAIIAKTQKDWPRHFDGHLPTMACDRPDKNKYPTGMPGCGDYVNEGETDNAGHMATDIVSDPRLPVATHVQKYPLGANNFLTHSHGDHLVEGGDFDYPQEAAPWVKPDFNHNGCLGSACDNDSTQKACTGLSCSHTVQTGDMVHEEKKGSMYKRPKF